ncbi:sugar ABC transporter permease [Streptomyces lunaelactis]|uniref:carbohydrate ABC transporter permease n=1 Tax=Streptomyces lunaelactis TaxID=1535768 RepID=UPI0015858F93|nr:sugar ABC transporter permease [Streptomyces lunaelactis]NUJ99510.1 sugar ABC transporter permease [Streptomyces lunaelactis]NUK16429.1 sugar ABC transporter permease [Streptomyces lunaelactis]NUK24764.1 sugar ABC transporter permease [Streptomyces lunaelactis]NUK32949.1 sugar ABC transporter permease [Streptomyces lunaelactis]NUK43072.1 sugar ABC transporter permease [Streptomyces lunaelactis]
MTATVTPGRTDRADSGEMLGKGDARRRLPRIPDRIRRGGLPYLLLLPAVVLELLIHLIPMVIGIVMSFRRLTQFYIRNWGEAPWTALDNYKVAVDFDAPIGQALLHSFFVTCLFTVLTVGLCWLFGVSAAIMMQDSFRGRGFLRAVFLTPYALPVYAAVITWAFMFQRDNGLINHVLHDQLGLTDQPSFWLIGDNSFIALVVVAVWKSWPFAFLIVMAGLQNIPRELYEAASIDGAGVWQQIRKITLPSLRPVNQVLVLVLFLWTFNDFNTPYVLFGRAAPEAADLISIHIYQSSFVTWNFGSGSAMSVLLLLFLLVVTAVYLLLTTRGRRGADA